MIASVATAAGLSALRSAEGLFPRRGGGGTVICKKNTPSAYNSFMKLKLQSSQPTLSYRVGPLI